MSSLQENSTVPLDVVNKRKTPFSRSDSFDKFQYTAFYTLQLAGTLLSQKSLVQVLDEVQYKSRVILEKYTMHTVWPTFKMIYAVILFWIDAFARYTKINVIFEKKTPSINNVEPEKTYCLRVQKRKSSLITVKDQIANETKMTDPIDEKRVKLLAEFDAVHPYFRGNSLVKSWKSDSDSEMGSNNSISTRQNIGMVVIVYGSATLVYVQLMFLAAFLQTAATPPGLVFLVSSLGYIAYIVFKMGFAKTKSKDESPLSHKTKSASTSTTPTEDTLGELPVKQRNGRLSRSSTRRFLYFHNKTLSKIKLL